MEGRAHLSIVSLWETGLLVAKNRLKIGMSVHAWVLRMLEESRVQLLPLNVEAVLEAPQLPEFPHKDPMDCLLVATARHLNLLLVTSDKAILAYGERHHVKTLAF